MGAALAAWSEIRARPGRTFLTMAGVLVAVAALMLIEASAALSERANGEFLARRYGRPSTLEITSEGAIDGTRVDAAVRRAADDAGISHLSMFQQGSSLLLAGDASVAATVGRVNSSFAAIRYVDVMAGAFLSAADDDSLELRGVIDISLATRLGLPGTAAVGANIRIAAGDNPRLDEVLTVPVHLVGVSRDPSGGSGGPSVGLYLTGGGGQQGFRSGIRPAWLARVDPTGQATQLLSTVQRDLDGLSILRVRRIDETSTLAPVIRQQRRVLEVVSGIALVVGAIGMLSVGLASVRERRREFGLRRALGCSRRGIFVAVVGESLITSLAASVLGVVALAGTLRYLPDVLVAGDLPVSGSAPFPVHAAVVGVVVAAAVGLAAGAVPAWRAARASVISAIRE